jgi:hypothetical protein
MKNIFKQIAPLCLMLFLLNACTSKRHAHLHTIPVQKESVWVKHTTSAMIEAMGYPTPSISVDQSIESFAAKKTPLSFVPNPAIDDTLIKKYKFKKDDKPSRSNIESDEKIVKENEYDEYTQRENRLEKYGITGFTLAVCSLLFLPLSFVGLVYCIKGLKAKKNGLAIAGLAISIIFSIFTLLYIVLIIGIIAAGN